MILVFLPSNFVTANELAAAIAYAVSGLSEEPPGELPDGQMNPAAIGFVGIIMNWETKIAHHYEQGSLRARNALSRERIRPRLMRIENVVFSLSDIQTSTELADGELEFQLRSKQVQYTTATPDGGSSTVLATFEQIAEADAERSARHARGDFIIMDAVQAVAEQHGLNAQALLQDVMHGARMGTLRVINPATGLARQRDDTIRDFYDWVRPADVNAWAMAQGATWTWEPVINAGSASPLAAKASAADSTPIPKSLTTGETAKVFSGIHYESQEKWMANLQDSRARWLMECRTQAPIKGVNGSQARWNPVAIAQAVIDRAKGDDQDKRTSELNARFRSEELLKPFDQDWATAKQRRTF